MACNNCSSHDWTVLEIRSQEELAKVLEQVNLSDVQVSSENLSVLNEMELNENCAAYILMPAFSHEPCDEQVDWTCLNHHCPKECPYCFDSMRGWKPGKTKCMHHIHICCPNNSCVRGTDEHGCETLRCA